MREAHFKVISVNISDIKGTKKRPVESIELIEDFGIKGDAHAGKGLRQVSLLADKDIEKMRKMGLELAYGDFAENITTKGIDLSALPVGTRLNIGTAVLEVSQIGKTCHGEKCEIFNKAGDCIMPKKGIFARVIKGSVIKNEDSGYYSF